jgi:hypothetical protein
MVPRNGRSRPTRRDWRNPVTDPRFRLMHDPQQRLQPRHGHSVHGRRIGPRRRSADPIRSAVAAFDFTSGYAHCSNRCRFGWVNIGAERGTRWRRKIRLRNSDTPANWKSGNFRHVLRDLTRSITDRIIVVIDDGRRASTKRQSQVKIDTQAEPIPPIPRINRG